MAFYQLQPVFTGFVCGFDTVYHDLLLGRLTDWLGIDGVVLQCSYLTGPSQFVNVNGVLSTPQLLICRVPQGSVLDPLLFTVYLLSSIITELVWSETSSLCWWQTNLHIFCYIKYNTGVNVSTKLYAGYSGLNGSNMLKLNPNRTEFMMIGNISQREKVAHIFPVELLNHQFV